MSKTLYIHGLDGFLSEEKRAILSTYTKVFAPIMDYRVNSAAYYNLLSIAKEGKVDIIIGTSMGGCMAYHLSFHLGLPALLFNPALPFRSVDIDLPTQDQIRASYLRVVIGGQDDIIDPLQNIVWLATHEKGDMDIRWRNTLGHRIPTDVFEEEVGVFFNKI
ncbi:MAG: YqiA/YcfP family alpha/beta fold hydrolase [Saprospiraceae bacterium]